MMPFHGSFADEFRAFEGADLSSPPPPSPVLFYGSSSIRLWSTLAEDFPDWPLLNRGFGGSTLGDCVWFFEWLVKPYAPSAMVFYAGDNDLDQGASPEQVALRFIELVDKIRTFVGEIPVTFLSIKPSPARWWNIRNIERANQLVEQYAASQARVSFLNLFPAMVDAAGLPKHELYAEDGLHLSQAGYELWTRMVHAHGIF